MRPVEFLELAKLIGDESGPLPEPRHRSAISRSYYAAFLDARDRISQQPHVKLKRKDIHDTVWKALKFAEEPLKTTGRLLFDLKKMRETADYDLDQTPPPADVQEAVRIAGDILATLSIADLSRCVDPNTGEQGGDR